MPTSKGLTLLAEIFKTARLRTDFLDSESLDFMPFWQIINQQVYDSGLDGDLLWYIIFTRAFKYSDHKNQNRDLTDKEKKEITSDVDNFLKAIPYKYDFFFELPENYPAVPSKLVKDVEIIEWTSQLAQAQEKINPITDFDKFLRNKNHRVLEGGKKYLKVRDRGLVLSGDKAFLESNYSPDRLLGIYYALHIIARNLSTDSLPIFNPTPRVYDDKNIFRANFPSPIKQSRAAHLKFIEKRGEEIEKANKLFSKLVSKHSDETIEKARKQICNALYWYLELLNTDETSLQVVFIVSSLDSLFPPRNHAVNKRMIIPTVYEKAPLIAEVVSTDETARKGAIELIEEIFEERNQVIHGRIEIHGYQKSRRGQQTKNKEMINQAEEILKNYLASRLKKFNDSK